MNKLSDFNQSRQLQDHLLVEAHQLDGILDSLKQKVQYIFEPLVLIMNRITIIQKINHCSNTRNYIKN